MRNITKILSLFILFLFTASFFIDAPEIPASSSLRDRSLSEHQIGQPNSVTADYPMDYTEVSWNQQIINEQREEQWNSSRYRFGPTLNWHTRNASTGEIIDWNQEIPIDTWFDFILEVPKTALSEQIPHAILLMGTYYNLSEMVDGEMNVDFHPYALAVIYYVPEDRFEIYSSKETTNPTGLPGDLPENFTLSDVLGPMVEPFAEIDMVGSDYVVGAESYWGRFGVLVNASLHPGFYMFNAMILDDNFQPIAQSQEGQQSGRLLGIDLHSIVNEAFGGYYTIDRRDENGNIIYTVNRGDDFNITVTSSNSTLLDTVSIFMSAPSVMKIQRWMYGPYSESKTRTGAWEWNDILQTYVWNAAIEVSWAEPKFGYHWEDSYTWINMGKEYIYYDPWGDWTEVRQSWPQYAISYDFNTNSWNSYAAYHYENHTWTGDDWEHVKWLELEPWSSDWPSPFMLNESTSSVFFNSYGKMVVNFRGHVSEKMLPSGIEYGETLRFHERVTNQYGRDLVNFINLPIASPQQVLDYENQRELAIDTPVSIVKITHKGQPYSPSWIFQADIGETFTVSSRLQGGIEYVDDIDGVAFIMYGNKERWGEEDSIQWWQYSDVQIQVKVSPYGDIEVNIYNYTVRTSWGYGEHYEWRSVEIAPGVWQTQRVLVEDWFWQEQIWDFTLNEGAGGWTDQHFPMQSLKGKMPVIFLTAGNVTYNLIGEDLRASFDVTPTPQMPALEWWWEYFYGNLTWVTDYESGWGSHTVLGWTEDTVYHYYNGTQIVYVEKPYKAPIFHNMQTGELYERTKIPYVIINGKEEPLKRYVFRDFDYTYETLLREEYDYIREDYRRFIRLMNGTELEVFGDQTAALYNITLNNGTWFLSFQAHPYYMGGMDIYSMIAEDGSVIALPWPEWSGYDSFRVGVVPVAMVEYTYVTYASPFYPYEPYNAVPLYMVGWPEYVGYDHWIIRLNGTWEPVDVWRCYEPEFEHLYMYFNPHDGRYYVFDWPWELMRCGGAYSDVFIPHYVTELYAYVTVGGTNYPIPAAGEPIFGWWKLDWVIHNKYVHEIAYINGTGYVVDKLLDMWGYPYMEYSPGPPSNYSYYIYQVNVLGTWYNLTDWGFVDPWYVMSYDYFPDSLPWVTKANGSLFIPEVIHSDWTVALGHRDPSTLEFEVETWIDVTSGFYDGDYHSSYIQDFNYTLGYEYVTTKSGEEYFYNSTWRVVFHNITLSNGTFFYSAMDQPQIWPTDISNWEIDTFYMVDIYGNYMWWYGWDDFTSQVIMINNVTGDPWDGYFGFLGEWVPIINYEIIHWDWNGEMWYSGAHYQDNVWTDYYYFIDMKNGTTYEVIPLHWTPESYRYNFPSWHFMSDGTWYNISGSSDIIYKAYQFEGFSKKLDYAPIPVSIIRTQQSIITGAPDRGMWAIDLWTTNPENGALDLDGNLATIDDQYFIKEFHSSTDFYNITHEYLDVTIMWEPDSETYGDEFYLHSFTGMVTFNWTFEWEDNYIWTKAATGETLSTAEFDEIKNLLFDDWGNPKPGYWGISWLACNFTSNDLIQQAIDEGWSWAIENTREWSWLWWELDEYYSTEVSNGTHSELMDINLAYQYAGMFAWMDENNDNFMDVSSESLGSAEMTHYWMPIDVQSVSFVTPGEAFGNFNPTDTIYVGVNDTVDFGVTFTNVTGIVFPFGVYSYWDWYVGQYSGSDFANFDERPTECTTSEFSLAVHFAGHVNETGSNIAEVKFDITVGDWGLDTPGGRAVLEGMSLAVSFYSDLTITSGSDGAAAMYLDDYGQPLSNEEAIASSNFTMASGLTSVALMNLGGYPYSWSKNASKVCTVDAQTVPLSAVSAIYTSGSGGTATTFAISSEQFYTLIGFKWWDGYALTVDPVFVGYISHGSSDTTAPTISSISHSPLQISGTDYVHIEATVTDAGGSDLAEAKVWDIDNNINYSMSYNSGLSKYVVDIERSVDGRYTFNYRIVASDNAGNVAVSSPNAFLFRDNIAPTIETLTWDNSTDIHGDEIAIISATVSDTGGSGIDEVTLTYSDAMGDHDVPMTLTSGVYDGIIPNHPPMTIVSFWVTVTDGDGNSYQSPINEFTFASGGGPDIYGPSLSLISHDPESATPTSIVTVSAKIQDPSGVDYAIMQYSINSGDWINVSMTASDDIWSAPIPVQVVDTVVSYRIVAADTLGNVIISGVFSYTVSEATTSTTSTTTSTSTTTGTGTQPGPLDSQTMLLIIGGIGALLVVVLVLGVIRKRN
ncbi:hypothetical protein EU527_08010 [Candidatus Thorarchaeota archaeon]|nr:MAG: hypothetical protein EU527_08010 [Candidatus Thorarchaeota archaeon]